MANVATSITTITTITTTAIVVIDNSTFTDIERIIINSDITTVSTNGSHSVLA